MRKAARKLAFYTVVVGNITLSVLATDAQAAQSIASDASKNPTKYQTITGKNKIILKLATVPAIKTHRDSVRKTLSDLGKPNAQVRNKITIKPGPNNTRQVTLESTLPSGEVKSTTANLSTSGGTAKICTTSISGETVVCSSNTSGP